MSHTFHQLYFHFVWATRGRTPLIEKVWRSALLDILHDETKIRGGKPIRHNAMSEHVHLLAQLPPTVLVSDFIGKVKGASAFRVNRDVQPKFKLQWQEGYGVISLRKDELDVVIRYIDRQEEHHCKGKLSAVLERFNSDDLPQG